MSDIRNWGARIAAVGLLFGLVFAIYGLLVMPVLEAHKGLDLALMDARDQIARYGRLAAKQSAVEALLSDLDTRQSDSGIYLRGSTDALAAVELQDRINKQAKRTGGTLRSIQVLKSETNESFKLVAIKVDLITTMSALHKLLYSLEVERPFVVIRNLDIKSVRRRVDKRTKEPILSIKFEICGFLKPVLA
jgi:hypothetical protein